MNEHQIHIIGGGLAGSEAAWQLAEAGIRVRLSEMRGGGDMTPAHQSDGLAELVCSNSYLEADQLTHIISDLRVISPSRPAETWGKRGDFAYETLQLSNIIVFSGDSERKLALDGEQAT